MFVMILKQLAVNKMKLNENKKKVKEIRKAISDNNGYCPCQTLKNIDTKCPCKIMREEKRCICELYV